MREYLRDLKKKHNFKKFMMEQKDFRYIEDDNAIFYPNKKHYAKHEKVGARISDNANIQIGSINPSCDNFEKNYFAPLEFKWVLQIIKMVEKYEKEVMKK